MIDRNVYNTLENIRAIIYIYIYYSESDKKTAFIPIAISIRLQW